MVKVGPVVLNKFFKIVHEALLLNKHGFPNQEVMLKLWKTYNRQQTNFDEKKLTQAFSSGELKTKQIV